MLHLLHLKKNVKKKTNMLLQEYRPFQVDKQLAEQAIKANKP